MKIWLAVFLLVFIFIACKDDPKECSCFKGKMGDYKIVHYVNNKAIGSLDTLDDYYVRFAKPNDTITQPYVRNINRTQNRCLFSLVNFLNLNSYYSISGICSDSVIYLKGAMNQDIGKKVILGGTLYPLTNGYGFQIKEVEHFLKKDSTYNEQTFIHHGIMIK